MSRKKKPGAEKAVRVTAKNPALQEGKLKVIGGSQSDDWNNVLANETINSLWLKHSDAKAVSKCAKSATCWCLDWPRRREVLKKGQVAEVRLCRVREAI